MEQRHGRLKLDVPEGWLDQSTLLFVEARGGVETVPAPVVTPTLSVRLAAGAKLSAKQLIEAEVSKLEIVQPGFARVSEGPFESPLGQGFMIHVRASLADAPIEQLAVAWVTPGDLGVIACAACGGREMKEQRPKLEAMLRAIKL